MIKIYGNQGNNKVMRQVLEWFLNHALPFKSLQRQDLSSQDLKHILSLTDGGFVEIMVSDYQAQKLYRNLTFDFEELSTEELIDFILKHPRLLRTPLVFDEKRLCIGYDTEGFRAFMKGRNPLYVLSQNKKRRI